MYFEMQFQTIQAERQRVVVEAERRAQWKREVEILRSQARARDERRRRMETKRGGALMRV